MDKSPDAFRTISEVAEVLDTPAHVLRFWESRFPQIRPVKRAGGRRYYRPADVALLLGIRHLLHHDGLTIRGVQKILREQGVRFVAGLSGQEISEDSDAAAEAALEAALAANFGFESEATPLPPHEIETAQIVALETALRARAEAAQPAPEPLPAADQPIAFEALPELVLDGEEAAPPGHQPPDPFPADPEAAFIEAPFIEVDLSDAETSDGVLPDPVPLHDAGPELADLAEAGAAAPAALPADAPLIDRLRALPPGALAHPGPRALADQLAALLARMTAPPQQAPF